DQPEPDAAVSTRTEQIPSSRASAIESRARPEIPHLRPDERNDGEPQVQAESAVRPALPAPDPIPGAYWQRNAARPSERAATDGDGIEVPLLPEPEAPPQTSGQ